MNGLRAYSLYRSALIGNERLRVRGAAAYWRSNLRLFILRLTQKWAAGKRAGGARCDGLRFLRVFAPPT